MSADNTSSNNTQYGFMVYSAKSNKPFVRSPFASEAKAMDYIAEKSLSVNDVYIRNLSHKKVYRIKMDIPDDPRRYYTCRTFGSEASTIAFMKERNLNDNDLYTTELIMSVDTSLERTYGCMYAYKKNTGQRESDAWTWPVYPIFRSEEGAKKAAKRCGFSTDPQDPNQDNVVQVFSVQIEKPYCYLANMNNDEKITFQFKKFSEALAYRTAHKLDGYTIYRYEPKKTYWQICAETTFINGDGEEQYLNP